MSTKQSAEEFLQAEGQFDPYANTICWCHARLDGRTCSG